MSNIIDYINKLVDNDLIEWKEIGDVCEIKRGSSITKRYIKENSGSYPVYSSQTSNEGIIGYIKSYDIEGEYVSWTTDGVHAGTVFYRNGKFNITSHCGILKSIDSKISNKFIYYFLRKNLKKYVNSNISQPMMLKEKLIEIQIPIPPIEIQNKIVEILDNFTKYEAELEAELEARTKQYKYYLNKLLDFSNSEDVEWKEIGDVCEIKRGERITKKQLINNGIYPVISGGKEIFGRYDKYNRNENTISICQYGTAGYVDLQKEKYWANDVSYSVIPKDEKYVLNKYVYYFLISIQEKIYKLTTKAIPDCLPKERIEQIKIPIPPIEVQNKIVSILDQFSSLVNDIKDGLPKEIELRKKQYKYYLNKLLGFK